MMLPMRISVSVTPAPWTGGVAAQAHTSAAARNDTIRLAFVVVCIDMASNAKLARACDAYPAVAMIARKMALLNSNVVAAWWASPYSRWISARKPKLCG
jgi:hypothetical protein